MYNVTQILQRCKENTQRDSVKNEILGSYLFSEYDPRVMSPQDLMDTFMQCDNKDAMEYLQAVCDIEFFPKVCLCPSTELSRVIGNVSVMSMLGNDQRRPMQIANEISRMSPSQLSAECGLPAAGFLHGKYMYIIGSDPGRVLTYSPAHEYLWTPRACLMLMVRAGGLSCSSRRYNKVCERVRRDWMVAAVQLEEEANRKAAEEASRRRTEERIQKVLGAQKTEPEQSAAAEKPKPEPKPEPPKVSDDSKVVINMTPDLLTVMIKTAVTESVNAVWQKFMDNREIFLNT